MKFTHYLLASMIFAIPLGFLIGFYDAILSMLIGTIVLYLIENS